ncbi:hypothetical protein GCM10027160_29430 [Streptomyces calidiresistens]|uniref:Uncharacterized protein n=1 Tax=Streptomyces calidiresistens TaxID=1485586 RepID=A0A7W3T1Y8_9ACTN|nr:hypothetical protein [Streptomyces calidiresistens]MBB0229136.1 hypothetical protein [Streptomyces calidiresistens]
MSTSSQSFPITPITPAARTAPPQDRLARAQQIAARLVTDRGTAPAPYSVEAIAGEAEPTVRLHFRTSDALRRFAAAMDVGVRTRPGVGLVSRVHHLDTTCRGRLDGVEWCAFAYEEMSADAGTATQVVTTDGTVWHISGVDADTGATLWARDRDTAAEDSAVAASLSEQRHLLDPLDATFVDLATTLAMSTSPVGGTR